MTSLLDLKSIDVMIVEDSPTQALLLQNSLCKHIDNIFLAKDGVEALEKIKQKKPSIIISDVQMPRMDGYELCSKLKSDPEIQDIPLILLTTLSDSMDVIRGIECGADSFLTKPYQLDFLLANISDVLANKGKRKKTPQKIPFEFAFDGKSHVLQVNPVQVTGLLLSTYSNAIQKNNELEEAYKNLNEKNSELSKLNEQKNEFLGMAAHDLRNPLGVIKGYSQLLMEQMESKMSEDELKMLQRIQDSSSFMLQLINDLLDISVIESGKVTLHFSTNDLSALVKEYLALQRFLADQKQISIVFKAAENVPQISCDKDKVEQIINNLITNAIKFSKPGSTVEVSISKQGNEVILAVKDQGPGIPAAEKDRLFHPFSKTSIKSTAGEQSTGLGLAIVKKIVEGHKGRIWVDSESGQGSTFFVAFPIGV